MSCPPSLDWRPMTLHALDGWPVAVRAALAQIGAAAAIWLFAGLAPFDGAAGPLAQGAAAAALSVVARLPWWWLPIQFSFVPLLMWASRLEVAPEWYLAGFVLLALVYWSTWRSRVPLYLSGRPVWHALESLLPRAGSVLDLGSGLGGPLLFLARRHPGLTFAGIEAAPLPWLASRLRAARLGNVRFSLGSFWEQDLGHHALVFAYLSPAAMPALWRKVKAEMRPGSVFVSVEFAVPGVEPDEIIETGARQRLYVWRF